MSRVWDDVISEQDRQVFAAAGYGQRGGLAGHPALLVVDVTHDVVALADTLAFLRSRATSVSPREAVAV